MANTQAVINGLADGSSCFKTLLEQGYSPVPIVPFDKAFVVRDGSTRPGGKSPGVYEAGGNVWKGYPGWQGLLTSPAHTKLISRWESWIGGGRPNAGILTGNVIAIDIDIMDAALADAAHSLALQQLGACSLVRYGQKPKRLLIYKLENNLVMTKLRSTIWRNHGDSEHKHCIEILGKGQQFVAFGTHPKTLQPYSWPEHSPLNVSAGHLPTTTRAKLVSFLEAFDVLAELSGYEGTKKALDLLEKPVKVNSDLIDGMGHIADAIRHLPADLADDYDEWIAIGHAIKGAVTDKELANALWHEFSEKSTAYDPLITDEKWETFKPTSIGAGSIYKHASDHGWQPPESIISEADFDFSNVEGGAAAALVDGSPHPRMRMISKIEPLELAPRQWVLGHYLLRGQVTTLVAPGGVGKSTLTLAWAASIASKQNLTGALPHIQGNAWVINNEDDHDELLRRYLAVKLGFNLDWKDLENRIFFTGGAANPFIIAKKAGAGTVAPGDDFAWAVACARERNISAIFVDPLVETHTADENDNSQMQQVIALYRRLAQEANCAVCLVHHTSKPPGGSSEGFAGNANAGRGASAVVNTARVGLTLFDMSIQDAKRYGVAEHVRNRYVRLDDAKVNLSLRSATANWMYRESIAIGNGDELGVLKPVTLVDRELTLGDDLLTRVFEIMEPLEQISLVELTRELMKDAMYHDEKEPTLRRYLREQLVNIQSDGKFTIQYVRYEANRVKEWVKKVD